MLRSTSLKHHKDSCLESIIWFLFAVVVTLFYYLLMTDYNYERLLSILCVLPKIFLCLHYLCMLPVCLSRILSTPVDSYLYDILMSAPDGNFRN